MLVSIALQPRSPEVALESPKLERWHQALTSA
jgi:hypothetical protein